LSVNTRIPLTRLLIGFSVLAICVLAALQPSRGHASVTCNLYASLTGSDESGNGSLGNPYHSVETLLAKLAAKKVGERTGCLRAGTYAGVETQSSMSSSNTTLSSVPGERARVVGRIVVDGDNDAVENLDLQLNYSNPGSIGLLVLGDSDAVRNNDITSIGQNICVGLGTVAGEVQIENAVVESNRIHGCGEVPRDNNTHGIYVSSSVKALIKHNLFYDNADRGVQLYPDSQETTVEGNIFDGNGQAGNFGGDPPYASSNNKYEHNVMANSIGSAEGENGPGWNLYSDGYAGSGNVAYLNCMYADNPNDYEPAYYNQPGGMDPGDTSFAHPTEGKNANLALESNSNPHLYSGRGNDDFHLQSNAGAGNDCLELAGINSEAASAASGWRAPGPADGASGDSYYPSVALSASGASAAAWRYYDSTNKHWLIQATLRSKQSSSYAGPELTWESPTTLSATGQDANNVKVGLDDSGNAFVLWRRFDGTHWNIQARTRAANSESWAETTTLYNSSGDAESPCLAVADDGQAYAIWAVQESGTWYVKARRYSGGSWESAVNLYSGAGEPSDPQIAAGNSGAAIAQWRRSVSGYVTVEARVRSTGGTWGSETALSETGGNTWWPRVAMNDSGQAAATWYRYDGSHTRIQARVLSGGAWGSVATLSESGQDAEDPRIGIDNSGNAAAVWRRFDGTNWRAQAAQYVSGTWGSPSTLSGSGQDADSSPWITVSENGNAIATWTRKDAALGYARVESSSTSLGNSWGSTESASSVAPSSAALNPNVAMADSGRAVGIWQLYNSSLGFYRIYAADRFF